MGVRGPCVVRAILSEVITPSQEFKIPRKVLRTFLLTIRANYHDEAPHLLLLCCAMSHPLPAACSQHRERLCSALSLCWCDRHAVVASVLARF